MLSILLVPTAAYVVPGLAGQPSTGYAPQYSYAPVPEASPQYVVVQAPTETSSVLGSAPWVLLGMGLGAAATLAVTGRKASTPPRAAVAMDETMLEKALAGELEEEGAENMFMSEVGWASYLDENCEGSYNMNERVSLAEDGYFTPDAFSNPLDILQSWVSAQKRYITNPLEGAFMTISNDETGARSYPKGLTEVNARTIKPKVKNFDKKMRITGIPGYNLFGAPSSKSALPTLPTLPTSDEKEEGKSGFSLPSFKLPF
jgi:hypothetical protein